jgi:hypothetical protein
VSQVTTSPIRFAHDISAEEAIFRKIGLRLAPFLFLCCLAAYLDRINGLRVAGEGA